MFQTFWHCALLIKIIRFFFGSPTRERPVEKVLYSFLSSQCMSLDSYETMTCLLGKACVFIITCESLTNHAQR